MVFSVSVNFRLQFFGQSVLQSSALVLTEEETFPGKGDHAPLQLDCVQMKVQATALGSQPMLLGPPLLIMKSQVVFESCTWERVLRLAREALRRGSSLQFPCLNSADLGKMLTVFSVDIF